MTVDSHDARTVTQSLHGCWHGRYGTAPCPVCQPEGRREQDALTISDGNAGLLLHCKKSGCSFTDVLVAAGLRAGDWRQPDPGEMARREAQAQAEAVKKERQALAIWREAIPIKGTVAEAYLRYRGITCDLPDTLRFHGACWHGPSARRLPAMVALVEGAAGFAIHRTYLRADGMGKAAVEPAKMMLGSTQGGAVRLTQADGPLVVAEGIETTLSLACGLLHAPATIWAALSTSGMARLNLPAAPSRLTIASDGDPAGFDAAYTLARRADALGWQVSMLPAPDGWDWNDILTMKGGAA